MISIIPYEGLFPQVHPSVIIAKGARIIGNVAIDEESSIWFNVVLRGDVQYIRIGKRTNIQDNSTIHVTPVTYPVNIGMNNTIGHGAILHGCSIGDFNLIGMGAIILDGATIGNYTIVAAGTLIPEGLDVPDGMSIAGVPGCIKRSLTKEEKEYNVQSAQNYVTFAKKY